MKITLTIQEDDVRSVESFGDHALAEGKCPKCGGAPFSVAGSGRSIEGRDVYRAEASCLGCRQRVGVLRVQVETVFGLEEDERVLNGPWKVY